MLTKSTESQSKDDKFFFKKIADTWLAWTCVMCSKSVYCKSEQDEEHEIICEECLSNELLWETRRNFI